MKKFRLKCPYTKLAIIFAVLLAVSYLPTGSFNAMAAESKEVDIDGITYEIDTDSDSCEAEFTYGKGREEITIPNKITYKGTEYKVDRFYWSKAAYYDDAIFFARTDKPDPDSYKKLLKKITFEKGVEVCGPVIHYKNLEEIVFEDPAAVSGLTVYKCPKLKSLYIPADASFYATVIGCPNLKYTIDSSNPRFKIVGGDVYSKDGKTLYLVRSQKKNYRVKSSVTEIAPEAFFMNDYIKSIYVPNSVKKIGYEAFEGMKNLKSVRLSKSLKVVENSVFRNSLKLKTITFPASVKKIEGDFGGKAWCKLKKIYINTRNLKKSYFNGLPKSCTIYVKNKKVKKQVRKYGFKGKVIIKK